MRFVEARSDPPSIASEAAAALSISSCPVTRLPTRTLAAYAGPGLPVAALGLPLVIYLPPYYAGPLGLDLAAVGFVFFLVRMLDMPLDPLLGHFMDGTRTRWGRFRPWLVAGGLTLLVATVAVFFAAPGITVWYLFGWLMLLFTGHSMLNVSHIAWGATLSGDYHERSRVYGWWMGGQMVGLITVLVLPAVLGQVMGADAPRPVHMMGAFILAIIPLTVIGAIMGAREGAAQARHPRITWADIRRLFSNRTLAMLLLADVLVNLAPGVTGALFEFVFVRLLGFTHAGAAMLLLVYFGSGLLALPLWMRLAVRFGKQRAAATACATGAVLHIAAFLVFDPEQAWLSYLAIGLAGTPYAAPGFLLRAMLADVGDEERLASGADRIGLLNAVLTTAMKLGYALPVGILFPILALVGFSAEAAEESAPGSLLWVEGFWIVLPPVILLPAALVLVRLPLSAARHAEVQAALARARKN